MRDSVYVLIHETNTGDAEGESDGYIEGVFSTRQAALTCRERLEDELLEAGAIVWPFCAGEDNECDWEHGFRIERWPVSLSDRPRLVRGGPCQRILVAP